MADDLIIGTLLLMGVVCTVIASVYGLCLLHRR